MKASNDFKKQIEEYLSDKALNDRLFISIFNKPNKNIDDCITYILNEVKKKAGNTSAFAMTDEEVYSLAIHYYDEDDIVVGTPPKVDIKHVPDDDKDEDIQDEMKSNLILTDKRKLNAIIDDDSQLGLFD
jgi:hypothetical protein